jgi:hypothetical protein
MGIVSSYPPAVTLGLDPRALHSPNAQQVQGPRVKPEGDDRGRGNAFALPASKECVL